MATLTVTVDVDLGNGGGSTNVITVRGMDPEVQVDAAALSIVDALNELVRSWKLTQIAAGGDAKVTKESLVESIKGGKPGK